MQTRIVVASRNSDKEIEKKQKRANCQEDRSAVDFAARGATQTSHEAGRTGLAGSLFAQAAAQPGYCVANDLAPHGANFIVHPNGNLDAVRPEHDRTAHRNGVTD